MPSLSGSLSTLSNGLRAFEKAMNTAQNNVANASTPGYAKLTTRLDALLFDSRLGLSGGVQTNAVQSSRDQFAETAVQRRTSELGHFQEAAGLLGTLNQILDVSGSAGIPAGLNRLMQGFSAWSVAPQSATARQDVVQQAEQFAASVRSAARQVEDVSAEAERRLVDTVRQINVLGERIAGINDKRNQASAADPSLDTVLHNTLDDLAKLVNFSTLKDEDGQVTVLIGGSTALTVGNRSFPLTGDMAAPPDPQSAGGVREFRLLDSNGQEATPNVSSGSLRALIDLRNKTLPSLIGGQGQSGRLNDFATRIAERINGLLTAGQASSTTPPTPGIPLFEFSKSNAAQAASSFQLNSSVSSLELATGLAAAQAGPPMVANGVALELASLLQPGNDQNKIDEVDFLSFYGRGASLVGAGLQSATNWKERSEALLAQSIAMRHDISGVSLDEEATKILDLQRGHQALSNLVAILNKMSDSVMSLLR